jgi:Calx-beta domain-containing protein
MTNRRIPRTLLAALVLTALSAVPALALPPKPKLSINDVTVAEGNTGTVAATFTVTLSFASTATVSATFKTADATATSPGDYIGTTGTISFPPGTTTTTLTVQVNGDLFDEVNETFLVNLTKPKNATFQDKQGVGTIVDDDVTPTLSISDATVVEGNSGATNAVFTLSLSSPSGQNVTVNVATQDGTATAGVDYVAQAGPVILPPGTISLSLSVPVFGDLLGEPNETFLVNLSGAVNATISDGQGQGTIIDDDAAPAISINDATVVEGDSGTTNATFIVSLSSPSGQTVTVDYATQDGTATAGSDYTAAAGTLTFPPGTTVLPLPVSVTGDAAPEANETFLVNLSNPVNATLADGQGLGTIADDDTGVVLFIDDVSVSEGNAGTTTATFTVSLSSGVGQQVTVDFATADGTATAPGDYLPGSGTLTFPPGSTTQNVSVTVNGDLLDEPDETFTVTLSNATNATIADGVGIGTILDDDAAPALSIGDTAVTEGDGSPATATFTVTLGAPSGQTVTVNYGTADGTATAGSDYSATAGTLTFPAGTVVQTLTVTVLGDVLDEPDETFLVNLTNPVNATVADGQGVGTIQDNDPGPSISIDDVSDGEGDSGALNFDFTVTLSTVSGQVVTVNFATANGTATAGSDYVTTTGTLTFPVGITTRTASVPVNGDTTVEANEDFFVNLSNPTNATIADGQGQGVILNDDGITIVINDVTVTEGDTGTVNAVFSVDLSDIAVTDVTVDFATADGTATAGVDYAANSGSLLFPAGTTSQPVTVTVNGDQTAEPAETFFVNLSNATGATIFDDQGMGTIAGEDGSGELSHGFDKIYDLAALPGPAAAVGLFRIDQQPHSSYEIVVDATSGDIGDPGLPVSLDRLASDASTVVQAAQDVGVGFSRSLRWENAGAGEIGDELVRVQSTACTTDCGADDQYRIRAYETTYSIPRFNNSGTQVTVALIQNPAGYPVSGTVWFWSPAGILLGSHPFTLAPKATLALNTATVPGVSGQSGSMSISHDGRYGDLAGKSVALEPATGFSFDSPMVARPNIPATPLGP